MDLCPILFYLICITAVVAVIGHGLWVMFAAFFKAIFGADHHPYAAPDDRRRGDPRQRGRKRHLCVGCGCPFPSGEEHCPECGLHIDDPRAQELGKLEKTVEYLQTLVKDGALEAELGEKVYGSLEARQQKLLAEHRRHKKRSAAAAEPGDQPIWQTIEELLAGCEDVKSLSIETRKQVLENYRRLENHELPKLSAAALLTLARIVRMAALSTRALVVYRALIDVHPHAPQSAQAAFEGGLYAAHEQKGRLAVWFLERALVRQLSDDDRRTAADLLARLRSTDERPALDVDRRDAGPTDSEPLSAVLLPEEVPVVRVVSRQAPAAEVPPSRTFGQMLAGFMEERNILWGELVGGLLIVGCSIALVISLWQTLETIPYFPFLIFAALTFGMFGAGLYTLGHWKLESTSRGLLAIATLLTPLSFLVLAGLWRGQEAGWLDWLTEGGGLLAFTFLVWRSGRILTEPLRLTNPGGAEGLLALAVIGAAGSQLLVPHLLDTDVAAAGPFALPFAFVSFAPAVCFALSLVPVLLQLSWRQRMDGTTAKSLFLFLGMSAFAAGLALGFLVYWSLEHGGDLRLTLVNVAFPLAVAGAPLAVSGSLLNLLLDREETSAAPASEGLPLGLVRVLGTCIGLGGMAVMIAAMIVAWPRPASAMGIGFLNCAAFVLIALRYRLPYAQVPALVCLGTAYLLAYCDATGTLAEHGTLTWEPATSARNGPALVILATVLAISSELLLRFGRNLDALCHGIGAALLAVIGMGLTYQEGLSQPLQAAWVSGWCGLAALLVNLRWRHPAITCGGAVALLAGCAFVTHWNDPSLFLAHAALLAFASGLTVLCIVLDWIADDSIRTAYVKPFRLLALIASTAAVVPILLFLRYEQWANSSGYVFWLASVWLAVSWKERWPGWFAACQLAVTAGVLLATSAVLMKLPWVEHTRDLGHLWSLQVYLLALAALSLVWLVLRFLLRSNARAQSLLSPRIKLDTGDEIGLAVDREIFNSITVFQFLVAAFAILPNVVQELSPLGVQNVAWVPLNLELAWPLLGLLTLGWVAALWGWRGREAVIALLVLTLTVPLLAADWFRDQLATASALRWGLGLCWLVCSALVWQRQRLAALAKRLRTLVPETTDLALAGRVLLLTISVLPVLLITAVVAQMGFTGQSPTGPDAASIFARLGWVTNMVVPLALVGVGLFGHGVRENAAGYVFSAGLVLLVSVTGGYALGIVVGGGAIDQATGVFILQLGAVAAGGWGLAWLLSGRWWSPGLLGVQAGLALGPTFILLCVCLGAIVLDPAGAMPAFVKQTGHAAGWLGLSMALSLTYWVVYKIGPQLRGNVLAGGGVLLAIITACALASFDQKGWLAYHVLILAGTMLGLLLLAGSWTAANASQMGPMFWPEERRTRLAGLLKQLLPTGPTQVWVDFLCAGVVLLALRGAWEDPGRPYWSCLATLAIAVLIGAQAVWEKRPAFVYISGLLLNLAGYLAWQAWLIEEFGVRAWFVLGPGVVDTFLLIQILCLATASALWSLVDWRLRLRAPPLDVRGNFMPFPHAAVLLALHVLALLVFTAVGSDVFGMEVQLGPALAWAALAATFLALAFCWWDAEASLWGLPAGPFYVLGLTALGLVMHETLTPEPRVVGWHAPLWLGAYLVAANGFMRLLPRMSGLWQKLRLPNRAHDLLAGWYWPLQIGLALFVLCLSVWICLDFTSVAARLAGPLAVGSVGLAAILALPFCVGVPPSGGSPSRLMAELQQTTVRFVVLGLAVVFGIEASWALLDQNVPLLWLHRNVLVLAVLTSAAALGWLGKVPGGANWTACGKRMGPTLAVMAGIMLAEVLVQEFLQYDRNLGLTPLTRPAFLLVLLLLAGVLAGCLWVAVSNPLAASERSRMRFVWAAEFLAVLLFVHTRLGLPRDFFHPFLRENWVFCVMAIGFVGVGVAELLRRRGLTVLSDPLHQTGIFLPLLPLLVFLLRTPVLQLTELKDRFPGLTPFFRYFEKLPDGPQVHAALWFLLCLLYACVAVLRRTSGFALLAALAANFGLWVIYAHHESLSFLIHPQVWLVPLGLIILAAEHMNRPYLSHGQSLAVRYVGLLLIYVSSSADMFIAGLGSVEYALVVALLSVAGVLLGILLRVRAFLFLGVAFLFLVVFAQIWHAAVDLQHTWVWWASGIVLGAAILTLFALFEKRRNDLVKMIDELRHWK